VDVSGIGIIGMSEGGRIAPVVANQAPDIAFMVNMVGGAVPVHEALVYEETHNLREMGILPGFSDLLAYPAAWSLIYARRREFWSAVGNFDPAPFWQKTPVPSLVLYGEDDTNVPSHRSAETLRSLGNPNIDVRIYEGSGHALESPPGEGRSIIREDALREIWGFIRSTATER
jgi:dienelactone hydrolase